MPKKIYLDESGDLGWKFNDPFRHGGSSRFLTIAYLIIPDAKNHIPTRLVRSVYKKFNLNTAKEYKGSRLTLDQKDFVVDQTVAMMRRNPDFTLGAITVNKINVQHHIRLDANKLYNYMINLAVLDKIKASPGVKLIRDCRSIKVKSGNSLIDYLQTVLWLHRGSSTVLQDLPCASDSNNNIVFIDWINNIVWSNYEDGDVKHFAGISPVLSNATLFF